jgi:hypothetical protein
VSLVIKLVSHCTQFVITNGVCDRKPSLSSTRKNRVHTAPVAIVARFVLRPEKNADIGLPI